ncbi:MAG TPA: hypothetical protein VF228_08810, partial [Iamia sp.]
MADTGGDVAVEGTARPDRWPTVDVAPLPWRGGRLLDLAGLGAVALTGLVLRVLQRSPLWLDE